MKKKTVKTKRRASEKKLRFQYFLIGFAAVACFFAASVVDKLTVKPRVLGASTYLAEDMQPESEPSFQNGQAGVPMNPEHENSMMPQQPSNISQSNSVDPSTTVDCTGPDNKHFSTTFRACQELNASFQKKQFLFTNLNGNDEASASGIWNGSLGRPVFDDSGSSSGNLRVPSSDGHRMIPLDGNAQIQPDHDRIEINASESGKMITLAPQVLALINSLLAQRNIFISSSSANGVMFQSGDVHAVSQFPLSVNTQDKSLSVVTPQGTTQLQTLPNQAVQNVISQGIMSQVQSEASTDTSSSSASASPSVDITTLNNQVVFKVNGVSNKKLFGLIPISFAKTSYVSAQNGSVVQTNESFFSKLLESISF